MSKGASIGVSLQALLMVAVIASIIGAFVLPPICALYNKFAGSSRPAVPEPSMSQAMRIMFVSALVNGVVGFLIGWVITAWGSAAGARPLNVHIITLVITLPICLLTMAGILAGLLPTTFGRALLVTLLYLLVVAVVAGIVVGTTLLLIHFLGANQYFRVLGWASS